jgi:hypothetical protein
MNYNGVWTNHQSAEIIKLSKIDNTDYYLIEWGFDQGIFEEEQKIHVSIGDENHAHVSDSKRFGETIIINIDMNTISINGEKYIRGDM